METKELYLRLAKPEIIAFIAILNGYDNMFSVRTVDSSTGLLHIIIGHGCEKDGMAILEALRSSFAWRELLADEKQEYGILTEEISSRGRY